MRVLRRVGDPLLVVVPAPFRHQRVQRIPVRDAVGLGVEARIVAPLGQAHGLEPRRPLPILARRDRGIAVPRRQDRDGGAVAVVTLLRDGFAAEPGIGQLGHRQRRQRLLDRDVDEAPACRLRRMDAGASRGQPADKRRLLADRADRRLGQIVDLSGQQPGDAAGKHQGEVAGRVVGARPLLAERRNRDDRRARICAAGRRIAAAARATPRGRPRRRSDRPRQSPPRRPPPCRGRDIAASRDVAPRRCRSPRRRHRRRGGRRPRRPRPSPICTTRNPCNNAIGTRYPSPVRRERGERAVKAQCASPPCTRNLATKASTLP